ncbi:GerMN domain-containing protein [Thermovenabulum sp.]|uniref:GerMN domain-containing protein n=1 Tax=Thermovenabulum sp. TaxID=3100335 RepID=UPI003C7D11BA
MRKLSYLFIFLLIFTLSFSGCAKKSQPPKENPPVEELKISDYYPIAANLYWMYEGVGNEYAGGRVDTEFIDKNRVQLSKDNGGTVVAMVFEVNEDGVKLIFSKEESYYRINYLNETPNQEKFYLKAPLKVGTSWQDGETTWTIESLDEKIKVPAGEYTCIKVVGKSKDSTLERYFAKGVGLVKQKFIAGETVVEDNLSKFGDAEKDNNLPKKDLVIFYPSSNIDKLLKDQVTESFKTGESLADKITNILKQEKYRVLSKDVRLLDLERKDTVLRLNFSRDLISGMNAGSSYEALILDSIVNTYGNNFGVVGVIINIEGKGYESGHFAFGKDEVLKVKQH